MQSFVEKLEDDIDTVSAMTIVFEYQSYINSGIDGGLFSLEEAKSIMNLLESWNTVIDILDFALTEKTEIPENITLLSLERLEAKHTKNWAEADRIRDELATLGWKMIDEAGGAWRVEKI